MRYIDPFTQFVKKAQVLELKTEVKKRLELVLDNMSAPDPKLKSEKDKMTISEDDSNDSI